MDAEQEGKLIADVEWIKTSLANHLAHHTKFLYLLAGAILSLAVALILSLR